METINLNKRVYAKNQYEKVIDTKFSQLANTAPVDTTVPTISVDELVSKPHEAQETKEDETNNLVNEIVTDNKSLEDVLQESKAKTATLDKGVCNGPTHCC